MASEIRVSFWFSQGRKTEARDTGTKAAMNERLSCDGNFHRAGSRDSVTGFCTGAAPKTLARDRKMQALCDAADAADSAGA